jgi:hypothetical protein
MDAIPRPDVGLLLLLFDIKAEGTPGRRLGLCEICDGGCWGAAGELSGGGLWMSVLS